MQPSVFGFYLGRIRKGLRREFEARAVALDITVAQYQVLRRLWEGDGVAIALLTHDVCSDGGTITGVLDRLEAKALIRRERGAEDRRTVHVWLTAAGRELQEPLMAIIAETNDLALAGISEADRAALLAMLEKVAANLEV